MIQFLPNRFFTTCYKQVTVKNTNISLVVLNIFYTYKAFQTKGKLKKGSMCALVGLSVYNLCSTSKKLRISLLLISFLFCAIHYVRYLGRTFDSSVPAPKAAKWEELCSAVLHENLRSIRRVVAEDPSILLLKTTSGNTLAHRAISFGKDRIVMLLVELNAQTLQLTDREGLLLLHKAVACRRYGLAKALALKDLSAIKKRDLGGRTPIHLAEEKEIPELVLFLQNPSLPSNEIPAMRGQDFSKWDPLYRAVTHGNWPQTELLARADPALLLMKHPVHGTLLHAAVFYRLEMASPLIALDPRIMEIPDRFGYLPLHYSIMREHIDLAKEMVTRNPSLIVKATRAARTPLSVADRIKDRSDLYHFFLAKMAENPSILQNHPSPQSS